MKFDFVIGNPPYQEPKENTSDSPVYDCFMDAAFKISDKVELIHPARFLFNAGKTSKSWNSERLSDEHFKVLNYVQDSKDVFPTTNIPGGVAITYRDANQPFGAIGHFWVDERVKTIIDKVKYSNGFSSLKDLIYLQNRFNLESLYTDFPQFKSIISSNGNEKRIVSSAFDNLPGLFTDKALKNDDAIIYGLSNRKRAEKYLQKKYLDSDSNIDFYKVILSAADGASGIIGKPKPARIIGNPEIGEKNVGYTQTFISIGAFSKRVEAQNLLKYLHTRFARFMVGTLKATNGLKIEVWSNVPNQDFSNNSDIDWSKPIDEIDNRLFDKYDISQNEIDFIIENVKEMEYRQ